MNGYCIAMECHLGTWKGCADFVKDLLVLLAYCCFFSAFGG